uniref:C2H2-type domain-containing protein n=1 Tax=Erpetoichthys calabaricus TaxID=27687 RepID=A0A8C4T808_ERPCA
MLLQKAVDWPPGQGCPRRKGILEEESSPSRRRERRVCTKRMALGGEDGMDERRAPSKQEDRERGTPEGLCVKSEDREGGRPAFQEEEAGMAEIVEVKVEDLEYFSVSIELQNLETENTLKQEESHSSVRQLVTSTGQAATLQNSVELKSESSEFEENISEGYGRAAEEQQMPRRLEMSFLESCAFSVSSFAQTSLQYRRQQKQDEVEKSPRRSSNLTATSLKCSSLNVAKPTQTEDINTDRHHVHNSDQEALYASQEWGKAFKSKSDCKGKSVHSTQKPYVCSECGKLFLYRSSLHRHKRIHTGEKPHCCQECGKRFPDNSALQRHTRVHTGEKPYSCTQCGKGFPHKCNLEKHQKIHTGEKPYCCSECGKGFSTLGNFHNHARIHSGEKPYCCSECGKRFIRGSDLWQHIRNHSGDKPHCCSECGKRFSYSSSLQRHKQVHTGEKPYRCSDCGKQFTDHSHLYQHTRIHTGEKPYSCSECGKRFTDSSTLWSHARIHTGEKPYCCSECGKRFSDHSSLRYHTRTHTGEKPYCCPECGKRFSHRKGLNYHSDIHSREKRIGTEMAVV